MEKPKKRHVPRSASAPRPGEIARAKGQALSSYRVGALPIINRLLERMRLQEFLRSYLPLADRRCRIAPAIGVILLLKNVLLCREPLYGIGEWAARYAPEALEMCIRDRASVESVAANLPDIVAASPSSVYRVLKAADKLAPRSVSYTHLDVYKRQGQAGGPCCNPR